MISELNYKENSNCRAPMSRWQRPPRHRQQQRSRWQRVAATLHVAPIRTGWLINIKLASQQARALNYNTLRYRYRYRYRLQMGLN